MIVCYKREFWLMALVADLLVASFSVRVSAQSTAVSTGGTDTVGGLIISSSVGEWDVQTIDQGGIQIQYGVQQPYRLPWLQTRLTGSLLYANPTATPMAGTQIQLRKGIQLMASALTDAGGQFDLGMVDTGAYQLTYQNPTPWRGVNATDALGTLRHFTHAAPLQGIFRQAADVNARNSINALEAQTIARRSIGLLNQFAAGDWLYDRGEVNIAVQSTPQITPMTLPIFALCYGDVNGSYIPGTPLRTGWSSLEHRGFLASSEPNLLYEWPIFWVEGGSLGAITLDLQVPDGVIVEEVLIGKDRISEGSLLYHQENDVLRVAWYGLDPREIEPGGELLRLRVRGVPREEWRYGALSELANRWAQPWSSFRLSMPKIAHVEGVLEAHVLPNPVNDHGRLWCSVPGSGGLIYSLSDAFGRSVWKGKTGAEGPSVLEIEIPAERLQQGTYFLHVIWQGTGQQGQQEVKSIKIIK